MVLVVLVVVRVPQLLLSLYPRVVSSLLPQPSCWMQPGQQVSSSPLLLLLLMSPVMVRQQ